MKQIIILNLCISTQNSPIDYYETIKALQHNNNNEYNSFYIITVIRITSTFRLIWYHRRGRIIKGEKRKAAVAKYVVETLAIERRRREGGGGQLQRMPGKHSGTACLPVDWLSTKDFIDFPCSPLATHIPAPLLRNASGRLLIIANIHSIRVEVGKTRESNGYIEPRKREIASEYRGSMEFQEFLGSYSEPHNRLKCVTRSVPVAFA